MKKNVVIGVLVILVLLLVITAEIFYLVKVRPRVVLELQGFSEEEKEITSIENSTSDFSVDESLFDEIDDAFLDVFDIMSFDKAVSEKSLTSEEALADISADLDAQTSDENSFQEMDQTLNELSF